MFSVFLLVLACSTPEAPTEPAPATTETAPLTEVKPTAAPVTAARVNLNTATKAQLESIPGITPKMVHEFEEYRPYVSISQFRKEIGKYVSAEQVAAYEPHVFVPVVPNECDAATLMQLPGVDEAIAKSLLATRPYPSDEAFTAALKIAVGAEKAKAGAPLLK